MFRTCLRRCHCRWPCWDGEEWSFQCGRVWAGDYQTCTGHHCWRWMGTHPETDTCTADSWTHRKTDYFSHSAYNMIYVHKKLLCYWLLTGILCVAVWTGFSHLKLQDRSLVICTGQQHQVVLQGERDRERVFMVCLCTVVIMLKASLRGGPTSRMPSASIITVQVPGFKTNGSTKLFWGTFTNVGSEVGAKTICLDCSEPAQRRTEMETCESQHWMNP